MLCVDRRGRDLSFFYALNSAVPAVRMPHESRQIEARPQHLRRFEIDTIHQSLVWSSRSTRSKSTRTKKATPIVMGVARVA
jgi:hypothetical protein